mgnify:CR=1 FL=1
MIYFENPDKLQRAQDIIALFGAKPPKTEEENRMKSRFAELLSTAGLKADDKNAIRFIYEKLGGLIRTEEEHKAVEEKKEEIKKRRGRPAK